METAFDSVKRGNQEQSPELALSSQAHRDLRSPAWAPESQKACLSVSAGLILSSTQGADPGWMWKSRDECWAALNILCSKYSNRGLNLLCYRTQVFLSLLAANLKQTD